MGETEQGWVDQAQYDLETAHAMLASGRYLYVLFCCQQAVEIGAAIELRLLDSDLRGQQISGRLCAAEVVRRAMPPTPTAGLLIGIRFV